MNDCKNGFDPVKGAQIASTGILGALVILGLMSAYAIYQVDVLPGGGPKVLNTMGWMPRGFRFASINRDYFDVMLVIAVAFLFMVTWEFRRTGAERIIAAGAGGVAIITAWNVALGGAPFFADKTMRAIGWEWTRFEIAPLILAAPLLAMWIAFYIRWKPERRTTLSLAIKSGLARWAGGLSLFVCAVGLYTNHPFYTKNYYENWRITVLYLFSLYVFFGPFYAVFTNYYRVNRGENRGDTGFVTILIIRSLIGWARGKKRLSPLSIIGARATGNVLRDLLVKLFFLPLMVSFIFSECGGLFRRFPQLFHDLPELWNEAPASVTAFFMGGSSGMKVFDNFYHTMFHSILIMDVGLCVIGYACTSRWLGNKSKSVEPTMLGWAVALACYPPFNDVTTNYLPYKLIAGDSPVHLNDFISISPEASVIFWNMLSVSLKLTALVAYMVYVWATMAFGLRFSNLTNRGIITRGPYAWIRHPAYLAKNIAWWAESVISFTSVWQYIFLAAWNCIYYLRAQTEERHLGADPNYRAYCKTVRYKFIPGVY